LTLYFLSLLHFFQLENASVVVATRPLPGDGGAEELNGGPTVGHLAAPSSSTMFRLSDKVFILSYDS